MILHETRLHPPCHVAPGGHGDCRRSRRSRFQRSGPRGAAAAQAIGFPSRDPDLDALPGFQQPPPGYGEVAFYWWLGDPLTKERLAWQLDQLGTARA